MKWKNAFYILVIGIIFSSLLYGQDKVFPKNWEGSYEGELIRYTPEGIIGKVKMQLHIKPTNHPQRWIWKIVYDQQARNYELAVIDAAKGIYEIDEKNSIKLASFYINNELSSHFGADFGYLLTKYRLEKNTIHFSTTISNPRPYSTTGGKGNVPFVSSFQVREIQQATLKKITK